MKGSEYRLNKKKDAKRTIRPCEEFKVHKERSFIPGNSIICEKFYFFIVPHFTDEDYRTMQG